MPKKQKQPKPMLDHLSRAFMIHICKDGTISYRNQVRKERVFNGVALPVYSVATEEHARELQIRFGRLQYTKHPVNNMDWYKLSSLPGGADIASRSPPLLKLEDLDSITQMFDTWYLEHIKANLLKQIFHATWQAVGSDALSACREAGERLDNDTALELILDAHRAEEYVRTPEQALAIADFRLLPWTQQILIGNQLVGGRLV